MVMLFACTGPSSSEQIRRGIEYNKFTDSQLEQIKVERLVQHHFLTAGAVTEHL